MRAALQTTAALYGHRSGESVALVTDGRSSDETRGFCIGHVVPEAAAERPIAFLEEDEQV